MQVPLFIGIIPWLHHCGRRRIDPEKVRAVMEWPTLWPTASMISGVCQLLSGAYKKLCAIASPLHLLTSANMCFSWTPQVEKTFQTLKELFTSAPVLTLPDPRLQFMVEVDASDVGVGPYSPRGTRWMDVFIPVPFCREDFPVQREIMTSVTVGD